MAPPLPPTTPSRRWSRSAAQFMHVVQVDHDGTDGIMPADVGQRLLERAAGRLNASIDVTDACRGKHAKPCSAHGPGGDGPCWNALLAAPATRKIPPLAKSGAAKSQRWVHYPHR